MALNVAAAYAAGFDPVEANLQGFNLALSNQGMQQLSAIPAANAVLHGELAKAALGEYGATKRLEMNLDALAEENTLTRRANRRAGVSRMAGEMLAMAFPGAGASAAVEAGNPLALLDQLGNFNVNQRSRRGSGTTRSNTYAAGLLNQLG